MGRDTLLETLRNADEFDAEWYSARYPDVALSGLDPAAHYLSVGRFLNRDPGPLFDTAFYCDTYKVTHTSGIPLVDYLTAPHRAFRDYNAAALAERMEQVRIATAAEWGALTEGLEVSYCIPVMNRLDDIKDTLSINLEENARFRGRIEFVVILFDQDDIGEKWIRKNFPKELASGLLRLVCDRETLDSWHFGKAKNAFRPHVRGQYYSSLDGDNFVTAAETDLLLSLVAEHPNGFVFHHFSGNWGDGTSGRVTMPTPAYRSVGYDPKLLPRQYDEVDFILGALTRFPAMPLVCVDPNRNIMSLSRNAEAFWQNERLPNRRIYVTYPERRAPLNQKGENYQKDVDYLNNMNNFNAALSNLKRAPGSDHLALYQSRLRTHKYRFLDTLPRERTLDMLFEADTASICEQPLEARDIPLFACVHNEEKFLDKFVAHYRSIGVTRFFFVDDHSDTPVRDLDLGEGVSVFRPKMGDFKSSKTLWLESLMRLYVKEGGWVVVADADEFLQLPEPYPNLRVLSKTLVGRGRSMCPGLLLDMVPGSFDALDGDKPFDELLDSFCFRDEPVSPAYKALKPVKWAFGDRSDISWRVDVRYHAFGTVDSLRKFPFFRLKKGRHLNQGFHAFHPTEGKGGPDPRVWKKGPVLPIFHYKMVRLFSEETREKMVAVADGYHGRTAENIKRIFDGPSGESLKALEAQKAWFLPARAARKRHFFNRR